MLEVVANWIINFISTLGYPGIVITMAIESALIPLPSEIIMPFSGYLVSVGRFEFVPVVIAGAMGNLLGSWAIYWLGYWGHERVVRRFVKRFGKWILFSEDELDLTERWLHKYHSRVILTSRVLPGVRTVISLPAGIARLPFLRFSVLTFFGCLVWSGILTYVGVILGKNWHLIGPIFHKFDAVIIGVVVFVVGWYIYHKLRGFKR